MRSKHEAFIDFLARRWETSDACKAPLVSCSKAEIAEIKSSQAIERLPQLYVEFMSRMGRGMGGLEWHLGAKLCYPHALNFKAQSFEPLQKFDVLVLTHDVDGDCALYCHVDEDDPMIYWIGYTDDSGEKLDKLSVEEWGQLSNWLTDLVEGAMKDATGVENL